MKHLVLCSSILIGLSSVLLLGPGPEVSSQSGRVSNAANYPLSNTSAANATANMPARAVLGSVPRVTQRLINENDPRRKILISVRYPQISGVAAASDFNALAERLVRRHIADFKRELEPPEPGARDRELTITYKTGQVDNRLLAIGFDVGTDWGGAHPGSYSFVLNYDLLSQRELALYELFTPNAAYLQAISDYCIRRLRNEVLDYESLRSGASPSSDNYRRWLVTRTGLLITFDAYQVASYAEGPKIVLVPWATLRPLIQVGGPVSHLSNPGSPPNRNTNARGLVAPHIAVNHRAVLAKWIPNGWRPVTKEDALRGNEASVRSFVQGEMNAMPHHPFYVARDFNRDGAIDFAVVITNGSQYAVAIFNGPFVASQTYTPVFYSREFERGDFLFWMTDRQFGNRFIVGPPSSDSGYIIRPRGSRYVKE